MMSSGGVEPGEHGEHSAVVVGGRWQVEFGEDVVDVLVDRLLADVEAKGDGGVRAAFGHEGEHFPFAVGEAVEWAGAEHSGDHLRVEDGAAGGDLAHRGNESV